VTEIDLAGIQQWVRDNKTAMLADLRQYVEIETPSDDRAALDKALRWLDGWLSESIGAPGELRRTDGGAYGDIEVRDYPGVGARPVLLLCHYDTVWDHGTLAERPFRVDGDRITGPGVFDMKIGLVQAVWAVRALAALGLPRPALRLLLNGDEEIGSLASRPVIEAEAAGVRATLVFEASADGAIKTARKGVGIFRIDVTGIESHAGLDPAKGVSAIDELARAVLAVHALADLERGTSVNVGIVRGGTRTNVKAGQAVAQLDVRVAHQAEADRIDAALAALRPHDPRATLTVSGGWNRPVMERGPATVQLYELARTVADRLGVDLRECSVGGASDGNFVAALGVPVLDGFGAVGDGAHARHEWASVSGMIERTVLAAATLHALAEG
jgi:glutamate carboxypeptidase